MAVAPDYVSTALVDAALYAGSGIAPGDPAPTDATRDSRLGTLITQTCRDFDKAVVGDRLPGVFLPRFETRLFSGRGEQILPVDPLLSVQQVQINSTPGTAPTWVDLTSELSTYKSGLLPLDPEYPKHSIFRQQSFYADPFPLGNVQIAGVWGICTVDPAAVPPTPGNLTGGGGLTQAQINALAPAAGGWWVINDDVVGALVQWIVFRFEHEKAGYSQQPGSASMLGSQATTYPSEIPPDVMRVINRYRDEDTNHPKLALVSNDGSPSDSVGAPYRWAGWITR